MTKRKKSKQPTRQRTAKPRHEIPDCDDSVSEEPNPVPDLDLETNPTENIVDETTDDSAATVVTNGTLSSILFNEQFSDQQLVFKDSTFPVVKCILATNSQFFANLWYLEFKDKDENPLDLSDLPVDVDSITSILRGFYDLPFTVTKENAYDFFWLSHYFQADKIPELLCGILEEEFQSWEWVVNFIVGADKLEDKRALECVGPHLNEFKTDCLSKLPLLSPSSLSVLLPFCSTSVSHRFFVECMVMSYIESQLHQEQLHNLLNSMNIELLSVSEWNEFLLKPLEKFPELKNLLMEFHFDHLRMALFATIAAVKNQYQSELETLQKQLLDSRRAPHQLDFKFATTNRSLQFSVDGKTASSQTAISDYVFGDTPLEFGNVYQWRVRYVSGPSTQYQPNLQGSFAVGINDRGFSVPGGRICSSHANCSTLGLSGLDDQFQSGDVLEVTADLVNNVIYFKDIFSGTKDFHVEVPVVNHHVYYPLFTLSYGTLTILG
ncbi:hypothetical protein GEMRC1_000872 [Eukaryota sp. GEM-RC1]